MPVIPTPPPMTLSQKIQTLQGITGNVSTYSSHSLQQAILDAQQIRDIAIEQAKKVFQEYVEQEQQKRKTILTIENIDKIKGHDYSDTLKVMGVLEFENHYEFTLVGTNSNQVETILLHRRQTTDKKYIMEYKGQTLWVSKDRLITIAGIIECMREV
jgi:hypothetical protein